MKNRLARLARVLAFMKANPEADAGAVSAGLSLPYPSVVKYLADLRASGKLAEAGSPSDIDGPLKRKETGAGLELDTGRTTKVRTLEELLRVAKVDTSRWQVERFIVNKYSVATKNEDTGDVTVTDLYQVKATLVPVPGVREADAMRGVIADLKAEAKRSIPAVVSKRTPKSSTDDPILLEISPFDLHLGKLAWGKETGVPYDTALSEQAFTQAVQNLWQSASGFPVQRVLLVLGQDFFTADNSADTTTAGTPQHTDSRFAKNFRRGWQLMRNAVEFLRERCPGGVDVLVIPGNHDMDSSFCAGEVLTALYEHTADVRVDNGPSLRKYFRYGTNLLGFTHGDKEKHAQLPLLMANERAKDWAETTCREFHIGHLHHARSTTFVSGNEFNSIRVRILPSLSGTDSWHHTHGYISKRAAEAYLWAFKRGYVGHLSWSPPAP